MTDDDATIQSNKENGWFRTAISVFALGSLIGITLVYLVFVAWNIVRRPPWMEDVFQNHAEAALGLPLAALVALCAVLFLEAKSGPIDFEALGVEFHGASGEIVLWVVCLLALVIGIKVLW